jgi:hypothetical protein
VNFSNNSEGGWFRLAKHSISVEIGGKKEKVQESENFSLRLKKNDRKQGVMMLTIEDDEGFSIMNVNGTDIYEILVAYKERDFVEFVANKSVEGISISERNLILETSKLDMREGEYKIILEDYATEADDYETIKVEERYLDVECDEGLVKGEDIVIVIRSSFFEEEVNVSVENFYYETLKLDEEGKKKVRISTEATDFGMHKVTVEVCGTKETKYVCVKKGELRLEEVPENATVGDVVHINGTSNFGNFAVLLVDDVFKNEARISDDEFEWNWDTIGELEGYKEIEVFIVNEHAPFSIGKRISEDWQKKEGVDASATIFLLPPRFSMTVQEYIAEGDDVIISGEARI